MVRGSKPTGEKRLSTPMHPLLQGPQTFANCKIVPIRTASKCNLTEFTQRVMSGKLLQLKQFQNQLSEVQNQLQMVLEENRGLNRLVKRQEVSLRRYEGENAGMPRMIRAHTDEIRILRSNVRQLKHELRDVQSTLREKESEVLSLKDALAKYRALAEDKKVFDHEKSERKIKDLEGLVDEQNREIQLLSRKILLESKNYQRQLAMKEKMHKETRKTLTEALNEIKKLEHDNRALVLAHRTVRTPLPQFQTTDHMGYERKENSVSKIKNSPLPELSFHPEKRQATPTI